MTKALIGTLSLVLVACSGSQPGPMGDGGEDGCQSRWNHSENFAPPEPPAGEEPECLVVEAGDHTSLLYGADQSACDASLGNPIRVRVSWPNRVSVFAYEGHEAEFTVEACE